MHFFAVEIHGEHGFFYQLAVFEAGGPENDVVGIPLSEAVVRVIGGGFFVDDRRHAVCRRIPVEHLDLVAVLQIDPAVATFFRDQEFDVEPEIAVGFFGHDICGAVFAAGRRRVVGADGRGAVVDGVGHDLPFDGQRGRQAGACPIRPVFVERGPAAIKYQGCFFGRFGPHADLGGQR